MLYLFVWLGFVVIVCPSSSFIYFSLLGICFGFGELCIFVCLFCYFLLQGFLFCCRGFWLLACLLLVLFFPRSIHLPLLIFYKKILEVANLLLIQRTSCTFLLSNIDFFVFPLLLFFASFLSSGQTPTQFSLILCQSHQ